MEVRELQVYQDLTVSHSITMHQNLPSEMIRISPNGQVKATQDIVENNLSIESTAKPCIMSKVLRRVSCQ